MEWWAGLGSQRATTTCATGPVDQTAASCGAQLEVTSSIFDPWLNADEFDLSAILNQTGCVTVTASPPVNELKPNTSQTISLTNQQVANQQNPNNHQQQQHHLHQQTQTTGATQSRLPSDNKRHVISIINNSTTSQQHQRSNGGTSGSLAGSPLSSSLGSSPLNQNANYMSSPHSSSSPPALPSSSSSSSSTSTSTQQQHEQQNIYQNYSNANPSNNPCKVGSVADQKVVQIFNQQQQQEHALGYIPECFLVENTEQEASLEHQGGQLQHGCAYMLQTSTSGRPQLVYQDSIILMPCSDQQQQQQPQHSQQVQQQQHRGRNIMPSVGGGSSLLSTSPTSSTYSQRQATKQTSNRVAVNRSYNNNNQINNNNKYQSQTNASGEQQKQPAQKARRCRHITDYVLADEEKRLLIKEGHTDFPMTCQSRPLTKTEERILRKIRRKIRNKKSAQCSRQRKKEYVEELERKYAAVLRENEELRRLLVGGDGDNIGTKFIDQQQQQQLV